MPWCSTGTGGCGDRSVRTGVGCGTDRRDPLALPLSHLASMLGILTIDIESLFPFPIHRGCDDVGMQAFHTVGIRGRVDDIRIGQIQWLPATRP